MQILLRHNHAAIRSLCWNLRRLHRTEPWWILIFPLWKNSSAVAVFGPISYERASGRKCGTIRRSSHGFPLANLRSDWLLILIISLHSMPYAVRRAFQDRRFHSSTWFQSIGRPFESESWSCRFSPCVVRSPISPGRVQGWVRSFCSWHWIVHANESEEPLIVGARLSVWSVWNSCCAGMISFSVFVCHWVSIVWLPELECCCFSQRLDWYHIN